jgi:L-rhamnose-H+ transport protein
MSPLVLHGVGLTMIAGIMSGSCMLPMKFARSWRWEHLWPVFSIVSLLILPWGLAWMQVHHLLEVYRSVPLGMMATPFLLGAGWGVAQILFGISVQRLGLGIGYAMIVGLGAVFGTLVPLFAGKRALASSRAPLEVFLGVAVMVLGIVLTAWGGQLREPEKGTQALARAGERGYIAAVLLAVLCGLMAPMLNYAFVFGQGLAVAAVLLGNTPVGAAYAVWPIALLGGLIPNVAFSLYLLDRNKSWRIFSCDPPDLFWALLMGILWMGAFALYGVSAVYLGTFGTSIGWGLFQIFMIMTAMIAGMLTAEWRSASRKAMTLLGTGMVGLLTATILLALGSR